MSTRSPLKAHAALVAMQTAEISMIAMTRIFPIVLYKNFLMMISLLWADEEQYFLQILNLISNAPYDLQITGFLRIDLNLFPDVADVNGHCVVGVERFFVPDRLIDLVD